MADKAKKPGVSRRDFVKSVGIGIGAMQLAACGSGSSPQPPNPPAPQVVSWPIAKNVYTTAQQQVLPVAVPPSAPQIGPGDVAQYKEYGYSAWTLGRTVTSHAANRACSRL